MARSLTPEERLYQQSVSKFYVGLMDPDVPQAIDISQFQNLDSAQVAAKLKDLFEIYTRPVPDENDPPEPPPAGMTLKDKEVIRFADFVSRLLLEK